MEARVADMLQHLATLAEASLAAAATGLETAGAVLAGRVKLAGAWHSALALQEECTKGGEVVLHKQQGVAEAYASGLSGLLSLALRVLQQIPSSAEDLPRCLLRQAQRHLLQAAERLVDQAKAAPAPAGPTPFGQY